MGYCGDLLWYVYYDVLVPVVCIWFSCCNIKRHTRWGSQNGSDWFFNLGLGKLNMFQFTFSTMRAFRLLLFICSCQLLCSAKKGQIFDLFLLYLTSDSLVSCFYCICIVSDFDVSHFLLFFIYCPHPLLNSHWFYFCWHI